MKVLLLNPPRFHRIPVIREERCEITERYSVIPPYSLLQIASLLRQHGHGAVVASHLGPAYLPFSLSLDFLGCAGRRCSPVWTKIRATPHRYNNCSEWGGNYIDRLKDRRKVLPIVTSAPPSWTIERTPARSWIAPSGGRGIVYIMRTSLPVPRTSFTKLRIK